MDIFKNIHEKYSDYKMWIENTKDVLMSYNDIQEFNKKILTCEKTNCFDLDNKIGQYKYGFPVKEFYIFLNKEENEEERLSSVKIWEPLIITDFDGNWVKICTYFYSGWCRKENISVCRDFDDWNNYRYVKNVLIITAYDVFSENGLRLSMGTAIPFAEYDTKYQRYKILVPSADDKGYFQIKYDFIDDYNVYESYLPFSSENILKLAYKSIGKKYVWGGLDCSGFVMDIFKCFGLNFPRDSHTQINLPFNVINIKNFCSSGKKMILKDLLPGSLLSFKGHIMIYLGEADEEFLVINALGSVILPDDELAEPFSVVITPLSFKRKNNNTWFDEIETVIDIKKVK